MAAPVVQATQSTTANANTGSPSLVANYPASVAQGDLLILTFTSWTDVTPTTPAGWTLITSTTATFHRTATYWREAPASPGTSVTVSYTAGGNNPIIVHITRISGHRTGSPIDAFGTNSGPSMPCNAPSLTPGGTERLSFIVGSWVTNVPITTAPAATGYTVHASSNQGNLKGSPASRALPSAAATGAIDFNFGQHFQYSHTHLLIAPQQTVTINPGTIASTAALYPPAAALVTQIATLSLLGPTATLPSQRIQPGTETVTVPPWTPNSGSETVFSNAGAFTDAKDYTPSGEVVGSRVFAPAILAGGVTVGVEHISTTALFEPYSGPANVLVTFDVLLETTVYAPGVLQDGQTVDLGSLNPLDSATELFEPGIVAGDTTIDLGTVSETVLFAPTGFDLGTEVPFIDSGAVLFSPRPDMDLTVPLIATTQVFTLFVGQYLVLAEPDLAVWGASGGYSARIDILDPGGDVVASTASPASGIVLVSGTVDEDITQPVVRECSVRLLLENTADGSRHPLLPARPGDPLDPRTGGALAIYAGPIRPSGAPALVKLGVFKIVGASPTSAATGDSLSLRGLSEETSIAATPFFDVFNVNAGTPITQIIGDMVTEAIPNVRIFVESAGITSPQFSFADGDNRMVKVRELANAIGMVARFDREGRFRVEHAPEYGDTEFTSPRWTFTEGHNAVMRDVARELDDATLFNGVIVVGEPIDTDTDPVRAELWDTNPNSPVSYNPNNPGTSRMGPRPKKVVSPLVYTVEQARAMATVLLTRLLAWPDRITVKVSANPSIAAGDLARIVRTTMGVDALYEVQAITHDLLGGASSATCVARA